MQTYISQNQTECAAPLSGSTDQTLFFDDAVSALNAAFPQGGTVNAIGFDDTDFILRAGYRLTDGECDVCIARGGETEFARARKAPHKKLILVPTHSHHVCACSAFKTHGIAFARIVQGEKPFAAVFDYTQATDNHAALFGQIASLELSAFDARFAARMSGISPNSEAEGQIAELVSNLTAELSAIEKNGVKQKQALTRAMRTAAKTVAKSPELLHISGAAQCTAAYKMLCKTEKRLPCSNGEAEMIFGTYVLELYIKSLTVRAFCFPPDNNRRIDCLCEYLGADIKRACLSITPIFPPQKLKLYEYRITEFRAEFLRMLADIVKRRKAAEKVFKRLYPDDGFCLSDMIDSSDAALCVALAPDVFDTNSMLAYLKQAGKLEKYLI